MQWKPRKNLLGLGVLPEAQKHGNLFKPRSLANSLNILVLQS